jgi:hypothetical protein
MADVDFDNCRFDPEEKVCEVTNLIDHAVQLFVPMPYTPTAISQMDKCFPSAKITRGSSLSSAIYDSSDKLG